MSNPFMPQSSELMQSLQTAWAQAAQQWGQAMAAPFLNMPMSQAQDAAPSTNTPPAYQHFFSVMGSAGQALFDSLVNMRMDPARLRQLQQKYMQEMLALWQGPDKFSEEVAGDRRFSSELWQKQPLSGFAAAAHLINSRFLMALADAVEGDEQTRGRVRFAVEQWTAATAPSNFLALNVDAQKKAVETQGESIARGMQKMLADMRKGYVSMTDGSQFEVGRNLALTEGAMIFENEIFQLIEYKPLTEKVHERPFLFVPPSINKYYILDLQPDNSMVRYVIEQGHHTFILSWRNPDASMAHATWDDFIENAIITAIQKVLEISGAKKLNVLGFCVGGTMLATALAVLNARKQQLVHSATFMTCLLNFSNPGVLGIFIDEAFVRWREMQMGKGGLLPAGDLLNTFSFLRPNELVWNYVVDSYLKGETPRPFDLLYWNCDSTNLPGPWYAWYLRNAYLENNLMVPGKVTVCGEKVDFSKLKMPVYLYGSREDHIVPIEGAYASTQVLEGCDKRFVMGASGHIAGVINPPHKKKRCYWTNDALPAEITEWIDGATEHPGSWWTDWSQWLAKQGGNMVDAPADYGGGKLKPIEPAPGRYVKAKAIEVD